MDQAALRVLIAARLGRPGGPPLTGTWDFLRVNAGSVYPTGRSGYNAGKLRQLVFIAMHHGGYHVHGFRAGLITKLIHAGDGRVVGTMEMQISDVFRNGKAQMKEGGIDVVHLRDDYFDFMLSDPIGHFLLDFPGKCYPVMRNRNAEGV